MNRSNSQYVEGTDYLYFEHARPHLGTASSFKLPLANTRNMLNRSKFSGGATKLIAAKALAL